MTGDTDVPATPEQGVEGQPKPTKTFVTAYAMAYFGVFLALLTPVIVSLTVKITSVVPADGVTGAVSLVFGVGALLALFGNPLFGRLSDRTRLGFGRRRPWIVGGMLGGLVGLVVIALAPSVPVILIGWAIGQLSFNAALAAVVAVLPDRVAPDSRGTVSGILGGMLPLATVVGALLAQALSPNVALMLIVPGIIGFAATIWLLFFPDPVDTDDRPQRLSAGEFFRSFVFNPRANPDFGWAWLSRFLLFIGFAFILTYQAVILAQDLGASEAEVPQYVAMATLANTVAVLIVSTIGGRLSDRLGRRKPFVFVAAILYAASMYFFITAQEPADFVLALGVAGIGYGLYLGTDLALVSSVLPKGGTDAAKDMGVFNIANNLPQSLAPAVAPVFLAIGAVGAASNWDALFIAAAVFILLGAFAILPVRTVR